MGFIDTKRQCKCRVNKSKDSNGKKERHQDHFLKLTWRKQLCSWHIPHLHYFLILCHSPLHSYPHRKTKSALQKQTTVQVEIIFHLLTKSETVDFMEIGVSFIAGCGNDSLWPQNNQHHLMKNAQNDFICHLLFCAVIIT